MARLILLLFLFIAFVYFIITAINLYCYKNKDSNTHLVQKNGGLQPYKTDLDYWYEKPHWYILPNGKKINLSEYMTYEEYKSYSKEKIAQIALNIGKKLENNNDEVAL